MSAFSKHSLFIAAVVCTVFCAGYISTLELFSGEYFSALEFYALLLAEAGFFACFTDFIIKADYN